MDTKIKRAYLLFEFLLLFFGVPLLVFFTSWAKKPVLILPPVFVLFLLYFAWKKDFSFKSFLRFDVSLKMILRNAGLMLLATVLLTIYVLLFERENLLNLPRKNPELWILMMVVYPVISAFIQEVIYRTFLFSRYSRLFKHRVWMILVSGVAFSFVHIVYYSSFSMVTTFILGTYLAYIYEKTKSVLFTTILHGYLGNVVFTVGLGHHFWQDMEQFL